jgi:hypothetical protein
MEKRCLGGYELIMLERHNNLMYDSKKKGLTKDELVVYTKNLSNAIWNVTIMMHLTVSVVYSSIRLSSSLFCNAITSDE